MAGTKLLPCPFCGGEAQVARTAAGYWAAYCEEPMCGRVGNFKTEAEAIEAWNTRAERTCRMTDRGECSECGAYIVRAWTEVHDFNGDMKRIDLRSHNYCPNCGARVTPKNSETTPKVVS